VRKLSGGRSKPWSRNATPPEPPSPGASELRMPEPSFTVSTLPISRLTEHWFHMLWVYRRNVGYQGFRAAKTLLGGGQQSGAEEHNMQGGDNPQRRRGLGLVPKSLGKRYDSSGDRAGRDIGQRRGWSVRIESAADRKRWEPSGRRTICWHCFNSGA